jgi:hypothetical protein
MRHLALVEVQTIAELLHCKMPAHLEAHRGWRPRSNRETRGGSGPAAVTALAGTSHGGGHHKDGSQPSARGYWVRPTRRRGARRRPGAPTTNSSSTESRGSWGSTHYRRHRFLWSSAWLRRPILGQTAGW